MSAVAVPNDADLVHRCLTDGADAFSEIVARYQSLICALTYNATGSLSRSEDLAQEVFLTAWKELRHLREPEKLRPWLCGIARRLTANTRRREGREPVHAAEELVDEHHAPAPNPAEQAISREEEAILWRSLEQIPETYRQPLILFYRAGQSVKIVAAVLDLTEDAAKQRLSRGRKMWQEQVALFVEGALRQSTPGRAFTLGVIAALPLLATSTATATAASLGATTAKGTAAAAGWSILGICSVFVGPIVGCLGAWFGIRASLESAESEEEREMIRRYARQLIALVVGFLVVVGFATPLEAVLWRNHTGFATLLGAILPILYGVFLAVIILKFNRAHARLRAAAAPHRDPAAAARRAEAWKTFEYKSPWSLLGLPLVHVRVGRPHGSKLRPAVGWVAIGDMSIGVLVSIGGIAMGGFSIGGLSLGLVAVGGVSLGGIAIAGLALGLWGATGGLAAGYLAHGGWAFGWHAAFGGMAVSHDFAIGASASAAHANDAAAQAALGSIRFFSLANYLMSHPLLYAFAWCPLWLTFWQAQRARKSLKKNPAN